MKFGSSRRAIASGMSPIELVTSRANEIASEAV